MTLPPIVDAAAWERARADLLTAEKDLTRARDVVAARRRRLPMTPFPSHHVFATPHGPRSLVDLFDGRGTLAVYQFMDRGPDRYCGGCTWFTDNVPASAPRLLAEHDVTWVHVSDMPLDQIEHYWAGAGLDAARRVLTGHLVLHRHRGRGRDSASPSSCATATRCTAPTRRRGAGSSTSRS